MAASHLPLVGPILDLLNQPVNGSLFPQFTDITQMTSESIQGSGQITSLEVPPIDMAPIVSFVNGKHEVLSIH